MTEEISRLRIEVDSLKAAMAEKDLDRLAKTGARAEKATDGLTAAFKRYVGVAALAAGATAAVTKLVNVQREFDKINAGLITVAGSAEAAKPAFEAIQDFATQTPFDLQQVSEAFIQLANRGLDPSERALTSYGNTASAMGRNLEDMVRAVSGATTGEFEPLKAFGIKAKKNGDDISLTFRGVTTTVRDNAREIEEYLIKLGEDNFASAMEQRMSTLDGAMSNLGDEWDKLFLNLSQSGVGDSIADSVRVGIDALSEINDFVASGQFQGYMEAMGASFGPWAQDAREAVDLIQGFMDGLLADLQEKDPEVFEILTSAWKEFPQNIRAVIQIATVHVAWFVEEVRQNMATAKGYIDAIRDGWGGTQLEDVFDRAKAAQAANKANLEDSIALIFQERDAASKASDKAIADADKRRAAYEKEQEAKKKLTGDRLAAYRLGGNSPSPGGEGDGDKVRKQREREFEQLRQSLMTEEESIKASYAKRLQIILDNTAKGSAAQQDLIKRLDKDRDESLTRMKDNQDRELTQLREFLMTEEQTVAESYRKRQLVIEQSTGLNPEQRAKLLADLNTRQTEELAAIDAQREQKRMRHIMDFATEEELLRLHMQAEIDEKRRAMDEELIDKEEFEAAKADIERRYHQETIALAADRQAQTYQMYGNMFAALGQLTSQFSKGQGKNAERMFKISKALNMAAAVMGIASGISEAQKLGYPMNIVEGIRVAAVGAVQIASIQSQKFSGAYDKGGFIPSGSVGVAAEYGDELVNGQLIRGPARVTSRKETADLMSGGGGGVVIEINVNVQNDGSSSTEVSSTGKGEADNARQLGKLIEEKVKDVIIREKVRPGGLLYGTGTGG